MLILVEGPDGSGKTTLIKRLIEDLFPGAYVINFGPPMGYSVDSVAAFARGQYYSAVAIFESLIESDQIVICDRFHLGEYVYGQAIRNYPEWLADKAFDVEEEILKKIGKVNVRLIILAGRDYEQIWNRMTDKDKASYPKIKFQLINALFLGSVLKTKLPRLLIPTDDTSKKGTFELAQQFIEGKV